MKWVKAALVGALGGLAMSGIVELYIRLGLAPFTVPPSAAFLDNLGLNVDHLSVLMHFGYAMFWSVLLVALFGARTDVPKGLGVAMVVLLIYLLVYAPIIGYGFFGFGGVSHRLAPDNPLYLGNPVNHLLISWVQHIVFGLIIGWLDPLWIGKGAWSTKGGV